jgi:hypothetical protein
MGLIRVIFRIIIKYWYWIYLIANEIYITFKESEMGRKGVFKRKQEKFITKVIAAKINPKNGLYRWLITKVLFLVIRSIDNFGLDRITDNWKLQLIPLIDYGIAGDIENVRKQSAKILDKHINFNWMDETTKEKWFDGLTMLISSAIESYIEYRD